MKQTIIYVGLDVDDIQHYSAALNQNTRDVIDCQSAHVEELTQTSTTFKNRAKRHVREYPWNSLSPLSSISGKNISKDGGPLERELGGNW